jgi:hypothetical protein
MQSQVSQLQSLHAEQQQKFLHLDGLLAQEMASLESEIQAAQVFKFYPNFDVEAKKQQYAEMQQVLFFFSNLLF